VSPRAAAWIAKALRLRVLVPVLLLAIWYEVGGEERLRGWGYDLRSVAISPFQTKEEPAPLILTDEERSKMGSYFDKPEK